MGLKAKMKSVLTAAPSRAEFEALARNLDAWKRIAAISFVAAEQAARYPGLSSGTPRRRLEQIAAVATEQFGLDATAAEELFAFLRLIEETSHGEREREAREDQVRNRPRCAEDYMPGGRFSPTVR
jgi:hypothetical protein